MAEIDMKRLRWLGHVLRMENSAIPNTALLWTPQGKRPRGRPKNTWRRTVEKEIAITRGEVESKAKDRSTWRNFVLTLCSTRSEEDQ